MVLPLSEVLTSNGGRGHHQAHGRAVKNIIDRTHVAALKLKAMDSTFVVVQIFKATARKYDAANLHETCKPIVDAVVRMGCLPDDDNEHLIGPLPVHGGVDRSLAKKNALVPERVRFRVLFFDDYSIRAGLLNKVDMKWS